MVEVKEETLKSTLEKVIGNLNSSESKLVSFTKKIELINPLHFFEAGLYLHMNRSFWMSTLNDFTMVGIGNAFSITEEQSGITGLESKWKTLIRDAVIHNPYKVSGTGISAIGGMDFDPKKPRTDLWNAFSKNELRIPKFMLVVHGTATYLTVTLHVNGNDEPEELDNIVTEQEELLLTYQAKQQHTPSIIDRIEVEPNQWKSLVQKTTEYISKSTIDKVVLARELQLTFSEKVNITEALKSLMESQPTSYIFAYENEQNSFIGATPERLVKVEHNELLSTCLAGTAPRGITEEEDNEIGYQLLHDQKNLEEHDFVVQMIKKSIEQFCVGLQIPDKPVLYKLRNLQHLYTPVRGALQEGYSIFDVIKKLHPTPALGGEPREKALSYIREHELLDRGWYGAPFGWVDSYQNGEFAVAIRSGLIQGDKASLFAGCGVVKESDPETEYEETRIKFLPMLTILGG
ncbi:isochorismate synthase MenF [Paucisalibacillus sp. EB02]|uniref:isochorismate synthase n=1 Tax=Paucisalibacillus sp. EB02 TaxID=1347087 RepID=UPI0004B33FFF|nr:isochorismate synthase [Paucisalibacillus sp. EB02]